METEAGTFYLGGHIDPASGERGDTFTYDADDLVTHGIIVGMTGSGKTGLGVDLLEEALLSDIPCLVIDPKGDMGNLRLIFPDFAPSDFAPWVDPGAAEREGVPVDELAARTAVTWKEGLAGWDIGPDRMRLCKNGAHVTIYTPGSTAGVPLNVLGSLGVPELSWDGHAEDLRDEIEGFVSSLLVLAGIEADPVSSPAHILLSSIIEHEWRAGRDLSLTNLVAMVPEPPLRKLGVFQLDEFYPKEDRTELAMQLNGLLASPSFSAWLEGEPLDIEAMLSDGDGTNGAVIYLAHLTDTERQFVVTLLLSKLVTWMRSQPGSGKLRALVYMDEVFGFAPPVAEPPAKKQILTILKQARAYGVGMVLATQNPIDLDYKAMSNAGTWMIGRLQTENDKKRILEGLADAGGITDLSNVDTLVSNLDKRQFVLRQAGESQPGMFGTRWAMSYLAGPLDRTRVEALTEDRPASTQPSPAAVQTAPPPDDAAAVPVAPIVADGVPVATLDPAAPWAPEVGAVPQGKRWRALAVATVHLRYDDRYAGVDHSEDFEAVIDPLSEGFTAEAVKVVDHDVRDFQPGAPKEGQFALPDAPIGDDSFWKDLSRDLEAHLVRQQKLTVWKNATLDVYSRVGESEGEFRVRCTKLAEESADDDLAKLKDRYTKKIDRVRDQISRADRRVAELQTDVEARRQQEVVSGVGDLLGSLLGGRSGSGALRRASSRRSQTRRTRANLDSAAARLAEEHQELADLELELEDEINAIVDEWEGKAGEIEPLEIPLEKSDVEVDDLRLVWVPVE